MVFVTIVAGAIVLVTSVAVVLFGLTTAREHERALPEWWIPLFLKASATGAAGTIIAVLVFEYGQWKIRDMFVERIVQQGAVLREDRQADRIVYDFDPTQSGGWGRLNRYDFRIIWEMVAGVAAIAALIGGVLAVIVARVTIRLRRGRLGFAVLTPDD